MKATLVLHFKHCFRAILQPLPPLAPNLTQLFDVVADLCSEPQLIASNMMQANLLQAMQAKLSRFRPSLSLQCL